MISSCLLLFGSIWWLENCFNKTFIHVIGIFMLFVFCHGVRQFVMFCFIITARKQSLRQGNIFTSVCHSFCPRGEGVCIQGGGLHWGVCRQGVCIQGGLPTAILHPGGVCLQEVCIQEKVCIQRGVCIQVGWADPFPIRYYGIRSTSGRYTSYWNAFLSNNFVLTVCS